MRVNVNCTVTHTSDAGINGSHRADTEHGAGSRATGCGEGFSSAVLMVPLNVTAAEDAVAARQT